MFGCQESLKPLIMSCSPAKASLIEAIEGVSSHAAKAVVERVWVDVGTVDMMAVL